MSAADILTGSTAGLQLLGGIFSMSAADAQAGAMRDQLGLLKAESEADIARYAAEAKDFKARQAQAFMKSGVTLEGSPLEILDETTRISTENIAAMRARTATQLRDVKNKAAAIRAGGRAALIQGVAGAAGTLAKGGDKLGWWTPSVGPEGPVAKKGNPGGSSYLSSGLSVTGFAKP